MKPKRPTIEAEQVLEYVFLAEFDLLRDSRFELHRQAWAQPRERNLCDAYYKLQRSKEEIIRINVELKRLVTFICDFESQLDTCVQDLTEQDSLLAYQMQKRQLLYLSIHHLHFARIAKIAALPGFTGSCERGIAMSDDGRHHTQQMSPALRVVVGEMPDDESDEEDVDAADAAADAAVVAVDALAG